MSEEARASDTVAFNEDLKNRGLKPHTRSMSVSCVREYLERCTALDIDPLHATAADLEAHITWLGSRPNRRLGGRLSTRTVRMHVNALRSYYAFLVRSGVLTHNPTSRLRTPAVPDASAQSSLSCSDIDALRGACQSPLDRAILAAFYGCGLRRSEGAALDVSDVDLVHALLHVRSGKGGRPRSVPMSTGVVRDLRALVQMLRPHGQTALFVNRRGGRLSAGGIYRRVKHLAVRAQITGEVTLHALRHAVATHLLERGLTLEQTRDFLGHGDIATTRIYTHGTAAEPEL